MNRRVERKNIMLAVSDISITLKSTFYEMHFSDFSQSFDVLVKCVHR